MKRSYLLFTLALVSIFALTGCNKTKVDRDKQKDVSGRWNSIDSQKVSKAVIEDIDSRTWIEEYTSKNGKKPVVIVGTVRNLSSERIDTGPFTKDLERELTNNGRVTFVASAKVRDEIRKERQEQQTWSREETQKRLAAETGADFMLQGSINTIIDEKGKQASKFYQVDLEMVHLETNEKVWMGGEKIEKVVTKRRFSL